MAFVLHIRNISVAAACFFTATSEFSSSVVKNKSDKEGTSLAVIWKARFFMWLVTTTTYVVLTKSKNLFQTDFLVTINTFYTKLCLSINS